MTAPQPLGYASQYPYNRDEEHLRLLSIFHYIAGGLLAFFGCFAIFYIVFGALIASGKLPTKGQDISGFGLIFVAIGVMVMLLTWGIATCLFISGRFMARRQHLTFSIVVAAISCIQVPFGTILGVFTLIVLSRPSVKAIYRAAA
ncbi:MAG: hypothetical protein ABSB42_17385 [Tepidisphaeraceae bacterium]|jgi:hypothetical protein